jgi:hypothetical protein
VFSVGRIYNSKLRIEKKDLIQVRSEFSPPTSKLVTKLAIKKQGGALILSRALRGCMGTGGFV